MIKIKEERGKVKKQRRRRVTCKNMEGSF